MSAIDPDEQRGPDPDEQRAASRGMWERAAAGWDRHADGVRDWGMPVSTAMIEALALQPGQTVLELAAGPGDTGFMAAELVEPGGKLISSDGAEPMVEVAKRRAAQAGVGNAEFKQLELEWIDLPTASVDAILCRWGIMLTVDPEAAAREARRVLRAGGRAAYAVWAGPELNPWATIPSRAMVSLGHAQPADPLAPGMFRLGGDGVLQELLEAAGFVDVTVEPVALERSFAGLHDYVEEIVGMSPMFNTAYRDLAEYEQQEVVGQIMAGAQQFTGADGRIALPGTSLVAIASA